MTTLTAADCQSCGACCQGWGDIEVTAAEMDRINEGPRRKKKKLLAVLPTMRIEGPQKRCVCLDGVVGDRVRCTIYEQRPQTCRDFRVNSDICRTSRKRAGIKDMTS